MTNISGRILVIEIGIDREIIILNTEFVVSSEAMATIYQIPSLLWLVQGLFLWR
jgi:hypothetical protein